jgi:hypothetical protein
MQGHVELEDKKLRLSRAVLHDVQEVEAPFVQVKQL